PDIGFPDAAVSSINGTSLRQVRRGVALVVAPGGITRMTTTILVVIALTGSMAPGARPEFQAQTDYGQALLKAANEKKPMAVLIGKGDVFAKMMTDSALTAEAKKIL